MTRAYMSHFRKIKKIILPEVKCLLTEWSTGISLASIQTTLFITSANVLFFINKNVFSFIPFGTGFVGEDWDIDFVQDFFITSDYKNSLIRVKLRSF